MGPLAVLPTEIGIVALHNVHMTSDETAKNTSVSYPSSSSSLMFLIHMFILPESRNFTPQSAKEDSHAPFVFVRNILRMICKICLLVTFSGPFVISAIALETTPRFISIFM